MKDETKRIFMVCMDDATQKDAGEMLKRVSATMSAVDSFYEKLTEVDEDGPNFEAEFAPVLNRLTHTLMVLYPDTRQMQADIKSIGDFTVRKI